MKKPLSYLLFAAFSLVLLTGCSSKPTTEESTAAEVAPAAPEEPFDVEIVISGNDMMMFDTTEFEVTSGQRVKLVFNNIGTLAKEAMGHNVVILNAGVDLTAYAQEAAKYKANDYIPDVEPFASQVFAYTKLLGPKESDTIYFTAGEPGEYKYICSFPAHFMMMQGTMVVKQP